MGSSRRIAWRAMLPRAIGLPVGALCLTVPLWELQRPLALWLGLGFFAFVWPWISLVISLRYREPLRYERWHILFDGFASAVAIVAAGFSPIATAVAFAMLQTNNVAAGGFRFVGLGLLSQMLGVAVGLLAFGFEFNASLTLMHLLVCVPMLIIHPLVIGSTLYGLALSLAHNRRALRELSRTDPLTGVHNRRYWMELAERHLQNCRRSGDQACLALIDVDHFKRVNDSRGHLAGDALLERLGRALREDLRQTDEAGRYGGDEFCVLLPGTDKAGAATVLEWLRARVAKGEDGAIALSIGIAPLEPGTTSLEAWIEAADGALYQAKSAGRDRLAFAEASLHE